MSSVMELKGGLSYNKQLWAVTCGAMLSTSVDAARRQLLKAETQIQAGVCHYQNYSEESGKKLSGLDEKIHKFVVNIARLMNLDALQAWDLMVFYLEHEFRGSEDNLEAFLENDTRKGQLMTDICTFYWSERAFLLKCIGIYLAYWRDEDHPFRDAFSDLLYKITPETMLKSLIKQLDHLSGLNPPSATSVESKNLKPSSRDDINAIVDQWMATNLREQLSVIHNLILFVEEFPVNWNDILTVIKLCKRVVPYRHRLKRQHLPILHRVTCSEVVLLLRMMDISDLEFAKILWVEEDRKLYLALDGELQELYRKEEHGPLLLAWMLFNFLGPEGDETFNKYRKLGVMATKLGVFSYLDRLLQEAMFKVETTKIADIAYTTVYNLIDNLARNFEPEQLQPQDQLLGLAATLLKQSAITKRFYNSGDDSGMNRLVNMVAKQFPLEFEPFVSFLASLASGSKYGSQEVMELAKLKFLLEPIVPSLLPVLTRLPDSANTVRLNIPHQPLPFVNSLVLEPGTVGTLEDRISHSVCWKYDYSFWQAIHNAEATLLSEIGQSTGSDIEASIVSRALLSVQCVAAYLKLGCEIESPMVLPIEMVFTIMERFLLVTNPKATMMAACLDVATSLINDFPLDVANKLRALDFLPTIQPDEGTVMTFANFARGHFFNAGVLGRIVVNEERPAGSFPLIRAYLYFLRKLISTGCEEKEQQAIAISGLVYVILEVFPRCYDWGYAVPSERTEVSNLCLQLFHRLLNPDALRNDKSTASEFERLLARTCLFAMLYTANGCTLLRICATGEAELKANMLQQTSWLSGEGVDLVSLVHLALSILNRVLLRKESVKTSKDLSATEQLIYASPNAKHSLQVVPNIAYYVYHCFNPRLPILAVKLLKRIALEVPMTLRACLAMDGDVIREAFVAKLDSPHHSIQLKVAILELITACIHTQPGATEAFFNIHHPEESKRLFSKDKAPNEEPSGCLTYACALLGKAKDVPALVRSSLYGAVVELLHALWMHHQKILLNFLRSKQDFWVDLCSPLFLQPSHSVRGYAQVLNILSLELYTFGKSVHKPLLDQIKKLFNEENGYMEAWSKFITQSLCVEISKSNRGDADTSGCQDDTLLDLDEGTVRERLALMTAWKDLLLVVLGELQNIPELSLSEKQQSVLSGHILVALEQEVSKEDQSELRQSLRPAALTVLAELLLVLQARWKGACFDDHSAAVSQLHSILLRVSFVYNDLPPRTRAALLGCGVYAIQLMQSTVRKDEVAIELLIKAAITIISHELQIMRIGESPQLSETSSILAIVLLQVLCEAISETKGGSWKIHLAQSKIVPQIVVGLSQALESRKNLRFAHSALQLLLALAGCEQCSTFLSLALLQDQLWLQLTPKPGSQTASQPLLQRGEDLWMGLEWSSIFCVGVNLVRTLLEVQDAHAVEAAANFCAVQEATLLETLLLARHTLDPNALTLTEATLKLLVQLSRHPTQWKLIAFRTFSKLVRGVSLCLDIAVGLLSRPQLLASMAEGTKQRLPLLLTSDGTETPIKVTAKVTSISNKLVNIVALSLAILRQLSPNAVSLLCDRELDVEAWPLLVEASLSAPAQPGPRQNPRSLTLGSLLAAINVFLFTATDQTGNFAGSWQGRSPLTRASRTLRAAASPGRLTGPSTSISSDSDNSEGSGVTAWVRSLDVRRSELALQTSLALLASQALLFVRCTEVRDHSLLRRELSTEMSQYVEVIRRMFGEQSESHPVETQSQDASVSDVDYLRLMAHVFQRVFRE